MSRLLVAFAATVLTLIAAPVAGAAGPVVAVSSAGLVDSSSGTPKVLQLRGVDRSGTEYACSTGTNGVDTTKGYAIFDGPTYDSTKDIAQPDSSLDAMRSWGINAVRIPLSDACWFGSSELNPKYSSTAYQQAILGYVRQLADHGMVAILSLHVASTTPSGNLSGALLPMPELTQGKRFWADVVQKLGSSPSPRNVVLDAFNEPHLEDVPGSDTDRWNCWRNGCAVNPSDPPAAPAPAGSPPAPDPTPTYQTAGMEQLVETIRQAESDSGQAQHPRPIMLGGLDYANDLSGWTAHLPTDPADALVASFHVYGGSTTRPGTGCTTTSCWDTRLQPILDAGRPVVAGEVGQYDCRSDVVSRYTAWADLHGASYLAWTWNAMLQGTPATPGTATGWKCDDGPSVLKFNDGTPTDAYGLAYCQHLRSRAVDTQMTLPASNPCPASRVPSDPPVDATPVPVTPPGGGSGTTTTTPSNPPPGGSTSTTPGGTTTTTPGTTTTPAPTKPVRTPAPSTRTVAVSSKALRLKGGKVTLVVACAKGSTSCAGSIRVRTASRATLGRRHGTFVVLSTAYAVKAGRSATLRVAPTSDGRALLRRRARLSVVVTATSDGAGPRTRRLALSR